MLDGETESYQSINQSEHIHTAPCVADDSEAQSPKCSDYLAIMLVYSCRSRTTHAYLLHFRQNFVCSESVSRDLFEADCAKMPKKVWQTRMQCINVKLVINADTSFRNRTAKDTDERRCRYSTDCSDRDWLLRVSQVTGPIWTGHDSYTRPSPCSGYYSRRYNEMK